MSKAICGSTSRLIDDDSPFQDRAASVQLTANHIAGLANLHFLLEKVFNAPGD